MLVAFILSASLLTQIRTASPSAAGQTVVLTGQVTTAHSSWLALKTDRDSFDIYQTEGARCAVGDLVVAKCRVTQTIFRRRVHSLANLIVRGHSPLEPPKLANVDQLIDERRFLEHLRIRGTVSDIVADEVDFRFMNAIIRDTGGKHAISISLGPLEQVEKPTLQKLLHAEIEATGVCLISAPSSRNLAGPRFFPDSKDSLRIITPAPDNTFDLPRLSVDGVLTPSDLATMGTRTLEGRVVATWGSRDLILQSENVPYRGYHHVELALGTALPAPGTVLLVAGQPETDTYRLNLSGATYRVLSEAGKLPDALADVNIRDDLLLDGDHQPDCYGYIVRLRGRITSLPRAGEPDSRLHVDVDGCDAVVDVSTCPAVIDALQVGCRVEVTGACLLESDNWRPNAPLPKIRGLAIVVRQPADIRVIARPPWWTTGRLMALAAGLAVLLVLILVWNRILGLLVIRRSRELLRVQLARNASELRIGERTRLAVELHDTLSQNLIGVACQITSAQNAIGKDDDQARLRLQSAGLTLKSCRSELRQVLSDLRTEALEAPDMAEALRQVLKPVTGSAQIVIRFNVPRQRLLDTTAHAILCIVRELVGNAVRHGGATSVRIAGAIGDGRLLFSVGDNGRGFDVPACPGPLQGHFGLDGIRNRVARMNGTFTIESDPNRGTYAAVGIPLPNHDGTSSENKNE